MRTRNRMRRALVSGLAAVLLTVGSASRVLETSLDGLQVCYEDHPSRTVVSYVEGAFETYVLDANKSGALDSKDDRIVTFAHNIRTEYYRDGILETRLIELPDGSFALGPDVFFGPIIVEGETVFDTKIDREAYDAARLRFELESQRLERIEASLSGLQHVGLVSCDPYGVLGLPPFAGQ